MDLHTDSLDNELRQNSQNTLYSPQKTYRPDLQVKKLYRQQLDELVKKKNVEKETEKQQFQQERKNYNQRLQYGKQAEKMKEISYRNYYQLLMNNQNNIQKYYISPFDESNNKKNQLIKNGIQEQQIRSKQWFDQQQNKQQILKKYYKQTLNKQIQQHQIKQIQQNQQKQINNIKFQQITLSTQQLDRLDRQKKLLEMRKYKQDLDKINKQKKNNNNNYNIQSNIILENTHFNQSRYQRHNVLDNPLPYNVQNPYILKQMQRQQIINNRSTK